MTGTAKKTTPAAARPAEPEETLRDRVARLELEKRALELELELNTLRTRAANLPGIKEL